MVKSGSTQVVRAVGSSGGSARTVTMIPADARVAGLGGGRLAVLFADHTLHVYPLSGAIGHGHRCDRHR